MRLNTKINHAASVSSSTGSTFFRYRLNNPSEESWWEEQDQDDSWFQKQQEEEQKDKQRIEAKTSYSERENSDPFGSKGKTVLNVVINVTVVTVIIVVISMFIGMLTNL